jgi:hypothetical protein
VHKHVDDDVAQKVITAMHEISVTAAAFHSESDYNGGSNTRRAFGKTGD